MENKKYTLVSLFAGAGGLDMGFHNKGFDILWANDLDKDACETHKLWSKGNIVCGNIKNIDFNTIPSSDVIVGGFPCLTGDSLIFTKEGYKKLLDVKKGDLVLSHDRKYHKVLNFFNQGKKEIYEITSDCFISIKATINHKFYARKLVSKKLLEPKFYSLEEILFEGFENFYFCNVSNKLVGNETLIDSLDLDEDLEEFIEMYSHLPKDILEDIVYNYFESFDEFRSNKESDVYEFAHLVLKGLNIPYKIYEEFGEYILTKNIDFDCFVENGYFWYPIKNIVKLEKEEFVYDIEVKDSHSFVVNGCISHNCQGFSLAGPRKLDDSRNILYKYFVNLIEFKQPKIFIAENVKGLLSMGDGEIFKAIIEDFSSKGYVVKHFLVNASDYEVPQDRERVIIIGFRKDLDISTFKFPKKCKDKKTIKDALKDLEEANDDEICNAPYSSRYMSRNRKRDYNQQSFTIPAMAKQVALHPSSPNMEKLEQDKWKFGEGKTRRLSYKECAAIQTFPKDMEFCGKLESKYKQIGNAVPVKLAEYIAKSIYEYLESLEEEKYENE